MVPPFSVFVCVVDEQSSLAMVVLSEELGINVRGAGLTIIKHLFPESALLNLPNFCTGVEKERAILIFSISCCWHHTIAINSDKTLNPKGLLQFPNSLIQSINKVLPPPQNP